MIEDSRATPKTGGSFILNNSFIGNQASNGGAILIDRANLLDIVGNHFSENAAQEGDLEPGNFGESGLGGAILYMCDPKGIVFPECNVRLYENTFNENKASRKGGALRYENANFENPKMLMNETE